MKKHITIHLQKIILLQKNISNLLKEYFNIHKNISSLPHKGAIKNFQNTVIRGI